jgi:hypothetical protein
MSILPWGGETWIGGSWATALARSAASSAASGPTNKSLM